jgi:hypothetical protein
LKKHPVSLCLDFLVCQIQNLMTKAGSTIADGVLLNLLSSETQKMVCQASSWPHLVEVLEYGWGLWARQ